MKTTRHTFASVIPSLSVAQGLDVIATKSGKVSGMRTADGAVTSFKGVPFAAPPVGELRWKAPQPVASWEGVRAGSAFGASPMQGKPAPFNLKFVDRPWEPVDHELAKTKSTYWANFVRTGSPNGAGLPNWPRYETQ